MSVYDTQNEDSRPGALEAAVAAVRDGKLIVLPTDTVYGIGADAFTPEAVQALLDAKGRGRDMPPPVLIGDQAVLLALAVDVPDYVEDLAEAFWPGPLTLILSAQPSLTWDLGETRGTVALRMPDDEVALELLRATGPLAVSSANRSGKPAALTVLDAATQLGDAVEVYLDGGPARIGEASTIIDTTVRPAEIVRQGALSKEQIIAVVGDIFTAEEPPADAEDGTAPEDAPASEDAPAPEDAPSQAPAPTAAAQDGTDPAAPADAPERARASGALSGPDGQDAAPADDEPEPAVSAAPASPADEDEAPAPSSLALPRESDDDARGAAGPAAG